MYGLLQVFQVMSTFCQKKETKQQSLHIQNRTQLGSICLVLNCWCSIYVAAVWARPRWRWSWDRWGTISRNWRPSLRLSCEVGDCLVRVANEKSRLKFLLFLFHLIGTEETQYDSSILEQFISGKAWAGCSSVDFNREKYAMMFDEPVLLQQGWWYVAWARVSGPSSDCGSHGQATITTDDR